MKHKKIKLFIVAFTLISTVVLTTLIPFASPVSNDTMYGDVTQTYSTAPLDIYLRSMFTEYGVGHYIYTQTYIDNFGNNYVQNYGSTNNVNWIYDKAYITSDLVPIYANFPTYSNSVWREQILNGECLKLAHDIFVPSNSQANIYNLTIPNMFVDTSWDDSLYCTVSFYTPEEITNTLDLGINITGKANFMYLDEDGNASIELGDQASNVTWSGSWQYGGLNNFHGYDLHRYFVNLPKASTLVDYYTPVDQQYKTDHTFGSYYWFTDINIPFPRETLDNTGNVVRGFKYESPSYGYDKITEIYDEILTIKYNQNEPIDIDMGSWLANSVGGFFEVQLFPGISIGTILAFVVGLGLLFAFLRFFAGG